MRYLPTCPKRRACLKEKLETLHRVFSPREMGLSMAEEYSAAMRSSRADEAFPWRARQTGRKP